MIDTRSWNIWDGVLRREVTRFHRISLCTTCMDRLDTLKQCLPRNLEDNADYPNAEFVILDYNSHRDDVWSWLSQTFAPELDSGRVVYYRTDEPEFYSMSHSRNLAFKLATGAVVNNVDADNFTGKAFASYLNFLANECPARALFAKGKQMLHGRVGFYKNEFVDVVGGYDEGFDGYGHDDWDIFRRGMVLGLKLMWYGGRFVKRIATPRSLVGKNMRNHNWRATEAINRNRSDANLAAGCLKANQGRPWGVGVVRRNDRETLTV